MRLALPLGLFLVGSLGLMSAACTKIGDRVDAKEVPEAVTKAVAAKYPTALVTRWGKGEDKGVIVYEADLEIGDAKAKRDLDLKLSVDGKLLKEEEHMKFKDLPSGVRAAFESSPFGKGKVSKVEKVKRNGDETKVFYEIKIKDSIDGEDKITIDADGKIEVKEPKPKETAPPAKKSGP